MKKVKVLVALATAIVLLGACGSSKKAASSNEKEPITVAIHNNVVPFSYVKGDKVVGAEVDIWKAIGKKLDRKVKFDPAGFDVLFGKIDNGEDEFLSSYLAINPTREKKYNFTEPYAHGFMKLLVLKNTNDIKGLEDCGGKKVAVTATSNAREFLQKYIKKNKIDIEPVIFEEADTAAQALKNGDVDAYFEGAGTNIALIQRGIVDGKFVGKSEDITDTAFLYKKGDKKIDKLAKEVNGAIKEMKEDGELKKIYKKWVGIDITDPSADMSYITTNKDK